MTVLQDLTCHVWIVKGIIKQLELTIIKEKIQVLGLKGFISASQFMLVMAFFLSETTNTKEGKSFSFLFLHQQWYSWDQHIMHSH